MFLKMSKWVKNEQMGKMSNWVNMMSKWANQNEQMGRLK